jgi:hypothetical protein
MASFGVEAIRYFSNARAAGVSSAGDLTYTFNRSNGFDGKLRSGGLARAFYFANTDCWESDIRDTDQGGDDRDYVDNVDIFWIETHGNHESDGRPACSTTPRRRSGARGRTSGSWARTGTPSG